jgi:hypothetical protein
MQSFEQVWENPGKSIPVEYVDRYIDELYKIGMKATRLFELIPEIKLAKKLPVLREEVKNTTRQIEIIRNLLVRSKSPTLTAPSLANYVESWWDVILLPVKFVTFDILDKVSEINTSHTDVVPIELRLYSLTAEEHNTIYRRMEAGAGIYPVYKHLEYNEVLESIKALDYMYITQFPIKYLDEQMIEAIAAVSDISGRVIHRSQKIREISAQHPHVSYCIHYDTVPITPSKTVLTTEEVIARLPGSLTKCKNINDAILDAVLEQDYKMLFTKTRIKYLDAARFNQWVESFTCLSSSIKNIPEEFITEEFLDRYYELGGSTAPNNIRDATPVEYIRANADRFPVLRRIVWSPQVLAALEWDPSLYYSADSLLGMSRKKSARSAAV